MSSHLDYWKAMRAKNEELLAKKSSPTKNTQENKLQANQQPSHTQPFQPEPFAGSAHHQTLQPTNHHQASMQYTHREPSQNRAVKGQTGRISSRSSHAPSTRNVIDSYTLDSSDLQRETERIQSSFNVQSHSSVESVHPQESEQTIRYGQTARNSAPSRRFDRSASAGSTGRIPSVNMSARSEALRSQDFLRNRDNENSMSAGTFHLDSVSSTTEFSPIETPVSDVSVSSSNSSSPETLEAPTSVKTEPTKKVEERHTSSKPTRKHKPARSKKEAPVQTAEKPPKDARKLGKSYLPGLDGLRCIAVMAVLLYHISPNQFVGGYIGVDLFFVISGFLITYRNLQNIQNPNKTFTLKNFWLRRARRLIPALVLVILVCVPLGAIIYPDILVGAFRQVAGALTYSTNWVEIIHGSNYFDQANPSLFKNFWSLAVEEQFYIIWPPLLLLLLSRRLKNSQLITIVATIAVVSMILMGVLASDSNYTRVYYGTDTHCFGLALGIILAFIWNKENGSLSKEWLCSQKWTVGLAPVGLIGFVAIVFLVTDTSTFAYPFGLALGSLFSLFLIASVIIRPQSIFTRIMELAPLRWIGVRSYGIYLWHWPMLVFGRILIPTAMGTVENVAVDALFALISFAASDLSYRFVEEPLRKDGFIKSFQKLVDRVRIGFVGRAQAAACIILVVATIVAIATAPEKTQLQQQIEALQTETEQTQSDDSSQTNNEESGGGDTSSIPNYDEAQMTGIPDGSTVTAIGDSLISGNSIGFKSEFENINFLAEPIRQWAQGVEVVKEGLAQGQIRQNVILDFGTNGGVEDEALVRQVLDQLGPDRRILIYNIYSPSTFVDEANAIYAKLAEEYPNVYLVDWYSIAKAHPEYLNSDRTHTNIEGQNAFVGAAESVFEQS